MPQRPASKSDRRNIGRPPPKKARDAPSVAKAIAILDWAWKQEVSGLQSEKHREVQLLNDQLSLSQEKCSSLSQQLETERAANMDLRDELDGTKSSLQDLSHRHASAKKFSDGLQNDLASRSKRNSSLEVEVDNLKEQLQTAKSELEEARQSCSSKETELQSSKKQFEDLQLDTEQRVKELEWKISDLERELLKKVDLLEKAQDEIARWQEKAENSEKIRQLIEAQMQMHQESVSSQVVALNSKIDDIQKFRNELRTQEIIQMLQDINSKELTSPQDMVEIENKIQGLAGRCVHILRVLTYDALTTAGRFDQNLNNIKEDLRARDSDKTSSDHTANKIIEHLELLKQDIDASSLLKEEIGELNIKITTLREKIKAKDAEISSMHEANKRLCEERDVLVDESRRGDARNTAENEDLRADLARARSDLAQANQDCESQLRQLASEREKLLQAKDSLRVAEEGLERLEKENVNVSDMVRSPISLLDLILCRTCEKWKTPSDCKWKPSGPSKIKRQSTTAPSRRPTTNANWRRLSWICSKPKVPKSMPARLLG
jgi:chromosome segregation ATPase